MKLKSSQACAGPTSLSSTCIPLNGNVESTDCRRARLETANQNKLYIHRTAADLIISRSVIIRLAYIVHVRTIADSAILCTCTWKYCTLYLYYAVTESVMYCIFFSPVKELL